MEKLNTYFELEAGSITTKVEDGELKFLTIYRVKMDDYTLPKGHVEDGESLEEASAREATEETGYPVKAKDFIDSFEYKVEEELNGKESYTIRRVYYFEGEVVGENTGEENPDQNEGKTVPKWMSYEDVLEKFSYDTDKGLIKKVYDSHNDEK
jgi:ADP-ribose pyrophosphatase YjhB (NUDIX family)